MASTLGLYGSAALYSPRVAHHFSTSRAPTLALLLPQIARCWVMYAGAFFLVAFIHRNSQNLANLKRALLRPPYLIYGVPALGAMVGVFTAIPKMG